jgi:hypothetical protein
MPRPTRPPADQVLASGNVLNATIVSLDAAEMDVVCPQFRHE